MLRDNSSMWHCCTIDTLYTSVVANEENNCLLISSTSSESDSSRERNFSLRISTLVNMRAIGELV